MKISSRESNSVYFRSLTSLRGVAAWWVVLYHFSAYLKEFTIPFVYQAISKGYLAVDLFFILSGFVIFYTYRDISFTILDMRKFYVGRFARIYPLHFLVLVLYVSVPVSLMLFSSSKAIPDRYSMDGFLFSALLVQNWGFSEGLVWNIPAWSISAEWFAYGTFPIFLLSVTAGSVSNSNIKILPLLVLIQAVIIVIFAQNSESIGDNISTLGVFRCVSQFFFGALICMLFLNNKYFFEQEKISLLLFISVLIFSFSMIFLGVSDFYWITTAFGGLILVLISAKGRVLSFLNNAPLYFLGTISYSTYLIHYFVKDWFKILFVKEVGVTTGIEILAVLFAIFLLSVICYSFVEIPFQRSIRRRMS